MRRVWRFVSSENVVRDLFEDIDEAIYYFCESKDGKKVQVELIIKVLEN